MAIRKNKIEDCPHTNIVKEVTSGQKTGDLECLDCGLPVQKEDLKDLKPGKQF